MTTIDPATLTALVRPHLGATGAPSFIPIGTGKHNASFWVETGRGRFVLRLAPPDDAGFLFYERLMMRQEPALHALIRDRTDIPVAEVIAHDFSRAAIDRDWLLLAALPGVPLSGVSDAGPAFTAGVLRQVGVHLRALHAVTAPACLGVEAFGYLGAHRPMEPQPAWRDAFRVMWHRLLDDGVLPARADDAPLRQAPLDAERRPQEWRQYPGVDDARSLRPVAHNVPPNLDYSRGAVSWERGTLHPPPAALSSRPPRPVRPGPSEGTRRLARLRARRPRSQEGACA